MSKIAMMYMYRHYDILQWGVRFQYVKCTSGDTMTCCKRRDNSNWSRRHTAFRSVCFALIGAHQYDVPAQVYILYSGKVLRGITFIIFAVRGSVEKVLSN